MTDCDEAAQLTTAPIVFSSASSGAGKSVCQQSTDNSATVLEALQTWNSNPPHRSGGFDSGRREDAHLHRSMCSLGVGESDLLSPSGKNRSHLFTPPLRPPTETAPIPVCRSIFMEEAFAQHTRESSFICSPPPPTIFRDSALRLEDKLDGCGAPEREMAMMDRLFSSNSFLANASHESSDEGANFMIHRGEVHSGQKAKKRPPSLSITDCSEKHDDSVENSLGGLLLETPLSPCFSSTAPHYDVVASPVSPFNNANAHSTVAVHRGMIKKRIVQQQRQRALPSANSTFPSQVTSVQPSTVVSTAHSLCTSFDRPNIPKTPSFPSSAHMLLNDPDDDGRVLFADEEKPTTGVHDSFTADRDSALMGALYAFANLPGCRSSQEDHVCLLPDATVSLQEVKDEFKEEVGCASFVEAFKDVLEFSCFAVFDGHNGDTISYKASQYFLEHFQLAVQKHFRVYLERELKHCTTAERAEDEVEEVDLQHRTISSALVQSLLHLDVTLFDCVRENTHTDAGSTACAAIFYTPFDKVDGRAEALHELCTSGEDTSAEEEGKDYLKVSIANLGDSRAVIGNVKSKKVLLETRDHRVASYPSERDRVVGHGGVVDFDRIDGALEVTRGLGDYHYKASPDTWWNQQTQEGTSRGNIIGNVADVYECIVHEGDFMVVASDGVWDRVGSEEVVRFIAEKLERTAFGEGLATPVAQSRSPSPRPESPVGLSEKRGPSESHGKDGLTPSASVGHDVSQPPRPTVVEDTMADTNVVLFADSCTTPRGKVDSVELYPCEALSTPRNVHTRSSDSHSSPYTGNTTVSVTPQCISRVSYATPVMDRDRSTSGTEALPQSGRLSSGVFNPFSIPKVNMSALRTAENVSGRSTPDTPGRGELQRVVNQLADYVLHDLASADNVTIIVTVFTKSSEKKNIVIQNTAVHRREK
ncbi:hypothetical protein AGDE_13953 [Angomonas deanei]|uniref:protein-serine/threonine phosphatase n=1 Tax=Angomonas deanei TaxID=59799 RepID=A0A7G2CKV9_9TRYP|nr:hypothetical protein AGDE_13953 [Angomonas deanei]CAD2220025.1 Protein phosphatase 2C, putative [Angomonas deanei]|eukprot:EPY21604.1 hypothetical protein AGDE_13953 [Angomonas deanei]